MKHFFFLIALVTPWLLAGYRAQAQAPAWQTAIALNSGFNRGEIQGNKLLASADGNLYLAGKFSGTVKFGSFTLTSRGNSDVYVAKWSPATSSYVWVQQGGGPSIDTLTGLTVQDNTLYLAGVFYGEQATFGSTTLAGSSVMTANYSFVAKLTDTGSASSFGWAFGGAAISVGSLNCLAAWGSSVYLGGKLGGSVGSTFRLGSLSLPASTNPYSAYIVRLTDAGAVPTFDWVVREGSASEESINQLTAAAAGLYVAGTFSSATATLGSITLTNNGPAGFKTPDLFVAKLIDTGTTGRFAWALSAGGNYADYAPSMAVSGSSIYLVGTYASDAITFGANTVTNTVPSTTGLSRNSYVAKITDAGATASFIWGLATGGPGEAYAGNIVAQGTRVWLSGLYRPYPRNAATYGYLTSVVDAGSTGSLAWLQSSPEGYASGVALNGQQVWTTGGLDYWVSTFGNVVVTSPWGTSVGFLASLTDTNILAARAGQPALALTLAPNPARTTTTVLLPALPAASAALTLLDALGRPVRAQLVPLPAAGLRHELELSGLPAGLYLLRVAAGGRTGTSRLVVAP